jgi:hypothetical protein
VGSIRVQLELAKGFVHQLEMARDRRALVQHEESLQQQLKLKSVGLSSLQRTIAQQQSRIHWLSEGDASTRFFHQYAKYRRRRNTIRSVVCDDTTYVDEEGKAFFNFFDGIMGMHAARSLQLNLHALDLPRSNLAELSERFTEEEVL